MKKLRLLLLSFITLVASLTGSAATIRVLAIGNSFSEDAIEQNLHEIAEADGITAIVGNLYIPGCSLEHHMECVNTDAPAYRYRKVVADGTTIEASRCRLDSALVNEQWDYISVQQASHFSGDYATYQPYLSQLIAYVKAHVPASTKIVFHQTWAYASDSNHDGFRRYGNSQKQMYEAIVGATKQVLRDAKPDILVPAGTAIQNARTSALGDTMNRDGYHLQLVYGRYTAACTWFEALTGKSVIGNTFTPNSITAEQKRIAQKAAHEAVRHPLKVTKIK